MRYEPAQFKQLQQVHNTLLLEIPTGFWSLCLPQLYVEKLSTVSQTSKTILTYLNSLSFQNLTLVGGTLVDLCIHHGHGN